VYSPQSSCRVSFATPCRYLCTFDYEPYEQLNCFFYLHGNRFASLPQLPDDVLSMIHAAGYSSEDKAAFHYRDLCSGYSCTFEHMLLHLHLLRHSNVEGFCNMSKADSAQIAQLLLKPGQAYRNLWMQIGWYIFLDLRPLSRITYPASTCNNGHPVLG